MSSNRELQFNTEADVIADVERLRAGNTTAGKWTLAQSCWHMATALDSCLHQPDRLEPNDAERKMRTRLDALFSAGKMPTGLDAPATTVPPDDAGPAAIDGFISGLRKLAAYQNSHVSFGPFGPVDTASFRKFILIHAAHHLSHFKPATVDRREGLRFADEDAAIADIVNLRRGYQQAGGWTLAQICWHLDKSINLRMQPGPFPPNTPDQDARQATFKQVMSTGKLPAGLVAPEHMLPPSEADDRAIDACIATLRKFKTFAGPVAPHRLFGHMSDADAHKQNLIHVAHHLSHLVPTSQQ